MARLAAGLAALAFVVPAAHAAEQPRIHYATALAGTNAFIGIAKKGSCFKSYLSDGTADGATLSVWFQGCLAPDGRTAAAERGGLRLDAVIDRRRATGTVTFRDGSIREFTTRSGDGGGIVGRRFMHAGRRHRSGWVVLRDNRVRWAITPVGRGLYGDSSGSAGGGCDQLAAERELLSAQRGPLLHQSGVWELRITLGRGPTSAQYNRLNQAIAALDEAIFELERELYGCG